MYAATFQTRGNLQPLSSHSRQQHFLQAYSTADRYWKKMCLLVLKANTFHACAAPLQPVVSLSCAHPRTVYSNIIPSKRLLLQRALKGFPKSVHSSESGIVEEIGNNLLKHRNKCPTPISYVPTTYVVAGSLLVQKPNGWEQQLPRPSQRGVTRATDIIKASCAQYVKSIHIRLLSRYKNYISVCGALQAQFSLSNFAA